MPSSCSASGCRSNYDSDDRIPIFTMPENPPELKQAWMRALRRDDISDLKAVKVCAKHFRDDDIEVVHKVPNGDGTFTNPCIHLFNPFILYLFVCFSCQLAE